MFISIGSSCNVKYQLKKYKPKIETLFFDWLITDMESVNMIMSCNNIDEILSLDNIVMDKQNISKLTVTSLPCCISLHDVGIQIYDMYDIGSLEEIEQPIFYFEKAREHFIEKYKRRFLRMIDYIKGDKKIHFFKYGSIREDEKNIFIQAIQKINPDCNFILICVAPNQEVDCIIKEEYYLEIKLSDKTDNRDPNDWMTTFLNWEKIFKDIEENA